MVSLQPDIAGLNTTRPRQQGIPPVLSQTNFRVCLTVKNPSWLREAFQKKKNGIFNDIDQIGGRGSDEKPNFI